MGKKININLTTIIELLNELLEGKSLYLSTDEINYSNFNNIYYIIENLFKSNIVENNIIISCKNNSSSKKMLKQLIILLRDIKAKFNKIQNIVALPGYYVSSAIDTTEMINTLFSLNTNNEYFKILYNNIENNKYNITDYNWINTFINNAKDKNIVNCYLKFRKFNKSNTFKYINENICFNDITEVKHKLECLLNNKYAMIPPIYMNEFTELFLKANFSLEIKDDDLLNYISNLPIDNKNKYKKIKWYDYINLSKYKEIKEYNKSILTSYENKKKLIFDQFKENIVALNVYIKSFDFLKKVVNENCFNKIYSAMYDENEMFIFLNDILTNLNSYADFISIKNQISRISDEEIELLNFCYDQNDTFKSYKTKLNLFPSALVLFYYNSYKENTNVGNCIRDSLNNLISQLNISINSLFEIANNLHSIFSMENLNTLDKISVDDSYSLISFEDDKYTKYIDVIVTNKFKSLEYYLNCSIIKFIKGSIVDLGYRVMDNFKFNSVNLELVAYNFNSPEKIVYIFIDSFITNSNNAILKLGYLTKNNIPIIYCFTDELFNDRNLVQLNIKTNLKNFLS